MHFITALSMRNSYIELHSPNKMRKLFAAHKEGEESTKNEIKMYKAISSNLRYTKIKQFLSRPFFTHARNENFFFYSRLQANGNLSNYCNYLTQQAKSDVAVAYLFNQFRRIIKLFTFLHNEAFSDEKGNIHQGITHGDIHFANILLDDKRKFLLGDLGCAYFADGPLEHLGMLSHIPPELHIAANRCYTEKVQNSSKSDIWALGLMLVELLTGQFPMQKAAFTSLLTIDDPLPYKPAKNANGYIEAQTVAPSNFFSDNLCGQALRIEWGKQYPESALCRDAFAANNTIKNLLAKPNVSINTHEILLNLAYMMLLPEQERPSAKQLKLIMDQLTPYFAHDTKAIDNFTQKMLLGNAPTDLRNASCLGYKTL